MLLLASGAAFGHFLLRVGDGAFEGLDAVAFGLADDFLDGAGYGGLDFTGCRVRIYRVLMATMQDPGGGSRRSD